MSTTTRLALSAVLVLAVAAGPASAQGPARPGLAPGQGGTNGAGQPGAPTTPSGVRMPATLPSTTPAQPAGLQPPSASPVTSEKAPAALMPLPSDYVIGPSDVLQITVWKNDSLSRVVPVRPDGKVSMPLLHDIQAAGLTAMQLRDKISTALAEYLPNPEVSVSVNEVRSLRVSVLGEVQKPGVLELAGQTSILEAIAMAGGFRDFASPSKIMIIRNDGNGQTQKIRFNYNRAVSGTGDEQNILLKPGDVIVVP
jgi:polysaccharide export outer membrane protein